MMEETVEKENPGGGVAVPDEGNAERILRVAGEEFLKKGYAGARTVVIAERAGVTHAMIHYYFATKQGLFQRVLDSEVSKLTQAMLGEIPDSHEGLDSLLPRMVESHLRFMADNPDLPRFLVVELLTHPDRMQFVADRLRTEMPPALGALQRIIDFGAASGHNRAVDARELILTVLSLDTYPFMAAPLLRPMLGFDPASADSLPSLTARITGQLRAWLRPSSRHDHPDTP
ncbi:MAG: TetR/AcrR family transcriptional regulator [Bacteroides sp.]|nr:TetR/AcrR family transcriptional regulator [Bacteroides sp.]